MPCDCDGVLTVALPTLLPSRCAQASERFLAAKAA